MKINFTEAYVNCGNKRCKRCFREGEKLEARPHGPYPRALVNLPVGHGPVDVEAIGERLAQSGIGRWARVYERRQGYGRLLVLKLRPGALEREDKEAVRQLLGEFGIGAGVEAG